MRFRNNQMESIAFRAIRNFSRVAGQCQFLATSTSIVGQWVHDGIDHGHAGWSRPLAARLLWILVTVASMRLRPIPQERANAVQRRLNPSPHVLACNTIRVIVIVPSSHHFQSLLFRHQRSQNRAYHRCHIDRK